MHLVLLSETCCGSGFVPRREGAIETQIARSTSKCACLGLGLWWVCSGLHLRYLLATSKHRICTPYITNPKSLRQRAVQERQPSH
jgi:hypothetical protein